MRTGQATTGKKNQRETGMCRTFLGRSSNTGTSSPTWIQPDQFGISNKKMSTVAAEVPQKAGGVL